MDLTFDIETIPCQKPGYRDELLLGLMEEAEARVKELRAPGNLKDPAKIQAWVDNELPLRAAAIRGEAEAKADELWRKTALDGALGEVVCIGFALGDDAPVVLARSLGQSEAQLIADFYRQLDAMLAIAGTASRRRVRWCGHNIVGFDLRFLFQRSAVLGVLPPFRLPVHARAWDTETVFDTQFGWSGNGFVTLDKVCVALGIPGKEEDGIDGTMVWDLVAAGEIDKVAAYCGNDVRRARAVAKRLEPYYTPLAA